MLQPEFPRKWALHEKLREASGVPPLVGRVGQGQVERLVGPGEEAEGVVLDDRAEGLRSQERLTTSHQAT